jgi:uncharacterized membrane protein YozB (DUF420 family)
MDVVKKLSPAVYGLIIFCFLLPFVRLTCSSQTIMTLTGFELVTGAEVEQNIFNPIDSDQKEIQDQTLSHQDAEAQPMALFALIAAVLSLALGFVKGKKTALAISIVSILGAIFLFLLKMNMESDIKENGQGVIQIEYLFGYWFSLFLFIAGSVIQWMIYREPERREVIQI